MDKDEIRRVIEESVLADRIDGLMAATQPAIRLHTDPVKVDKLPLGASRMGGRPDMPVDLPWPKRLGRPLEFLAQINFRDAASVARLPGMPEAGWLAVFYDCFRMDYGGEDDFWQVLFFDTPASSLERLDPPEDESDPSVYEDDLEAAWQAPYEFRTCEVEMEKVWTCPLDERALCAAGAAGTKVSQELYRSTWEAWWQLRQDFAAEVGEPHHILGGFAAPIQNDPILGEAWTHLLQLDTDVNGTDWMWGDKGRMYFQIRRIDLEAKDFSQVKASWDFY